jgi:hypothetical protein
MLIHGGRGHGAQQKKVFLKNYGFHSNLESSQQRFMFRLKSYSLMFPMPISNTSS